MPSPTNADPCTKSFAHAYAEGSDICVWCGHQRLPPPDDTQADRNHEDAYDPGSADVVEVASGEVAPASTYAGYAPAQTNPGPLEPILERDPEQPAPPVIEVITVQDNGLITDGLITIDTFDAEEPTPRAPVEDLLHAALPWYVSGGSPMGWSKLKTAKLCLRSFFYAHVLGLRQKFEPRRPQDDEGKERVNALELGTLVHACVEAFYRTADANKAMAPAMAVQEQYPVLALEAVRLANFYLRKFNSYEARHWDLRAVERESRFYYPARKCCGKRRRLLVSSRHDHVYRHLQPGERKLPPGVPGKNIRIAELKCLDKDEPLWDASNARRVTAGALLRQHVHVPTLDLDSGELADHAADFTNNGVVPIHKIVLSSGREALLTDNHPVWTDRG